MRAMKLIQSHRLMHTRFPGTNFPLCRGMCVRRMVRELVDTQFSPDGLARVLRRTVLAHRNTRFRRVTEYNKAGRAKLVLGLRRCRPVRTRQSRLVMPMNR